MAFVTPTSVLTLRRTVAVGGSSFVREPLVPPPPREKPQRVTALFNFGGPFKSDRPRDFRTASHAARHNVPDSAKLTAYVVAVQSVCPAKHHFQLTLDAAFLSQTHRAPGQFIQIARNIRQKRGSPARVLAFLTLSSPPGGNSDGNIEVMFAAGADPLGLRSLKIGDQLNVSPMMGSGIDHTRVTNSSGDLYAFTDCVQGFATLKSLIEWPQFRAMSGEGANRTNHIVIYYAIPSPKSLPFHQRLSTWSVFGVNLVPLPGVSIMEYMSAPDALGRSRHSLSLDHALACVLSPETFESLFCALILQGFRRDAIHRYTEECVAAQVRMFDKSAFNAWESTTDSAQREAVEHEIWRKWVEIREKMRSEFERKWAQRARNIHYSDRAQQEKEQAWASWFAKNQDQWNQVEWNNEQWGSYWSSWKSSAGAGGGASSGSSQDSGSGSRYSWSQQNSQEYWDWVKRGTESKKSSSSSSSGSYGAWDQEPYGGGWGSSSKSSYQKSGYKYNYEETEEDKAKRGAYGGGYSGNGQSGQNNGPWGQWSNRNSGQRRSYSSNSGQKNWGSGGSRSSRSSGVFGDIDFYEVLGITSSASRSDIKKAYRKKAMQHHPDLNPNQSEDGNVKMKQIVVAWSILKDEDKRQKYDKYGAGGL